MDCRLRGYDDNLSFAKETGVVLRNFSWVIPGKVAGSAMPGGHSSQREYILGDLAEMFDQGVRCLISLTRTHENFKTLCGELTMEWIHFPIPDFMVPDNSRAFDVLVDQCIEMIKNGKPVCAHCHAGIGRTGMLLSCLVGKLLALDPEAAIKTVRQSRPALDTPDQEAYVYRYLQEYGLQ
ncbi:MAG: hypothetical protein GF398_08385 [Chitinivibrionales bacterium]|nr:hypothetical protein [Chitinivibrionales bacterium]